MINDMSQSLEEHRIVRDVKNPSPLINLSFSRICWGFPVDFMHCMLLGVVKQISQFQAHSQIPSPGTWSNLHVTNQFLKRYLICFYHFSAWKAGKGVPILLNEEMYSTICKIAAYNKDRDETFLFARPTGGCNTPFCASAGMGDLAHEAELQRPQYVRCTRLRKHLATMSQVLDLKENELEQLANHIGHDLATHREYYRLPYETMLLSKVSKILHLADKGQFATTSGKKLNDIHITSEDEAESDSVNDTDEECPSTSSSNDSQCKPPSIDRDRDGPGGYAGAVSRWYHGSGGRARHM